MQLSVIIVNFNVKYFLEQCLHSVLKACTHIDSEILVVDNASADDSVNYLQKIFPKVKFIASKTNLGFGVANNLALKQSSGDYVLFLNPDTLVPEDCFTNCLQFFKSHPNTGALGVQMVDGSGKFLPESKRAIPSLKTAFYKLIGLSVVFPKSGIFNKYALGNLNKNHNHEVDVLAGAFMMITKEVAQKTNGFDEAFFMYGEDIDLSYRIKKLGYKNYFLGEQQIIHFKGESTKRASLNYVRMFYNAMSIFVSKHYATSKAKLFTAGINLAIWLRAFVSIIQNFFKKLGLPFFDAIIVFISLWVTNWFWVHILREGKPFDNIATDYALPGFTVVFILGAFLSGIYDNLYKPLKALASSFSAIIIMLATYSLLPEYIRFSRGVILGGGVFSGLMVTLFRWLLVKLSIIKQIGEEDKIGKTLIVGNNQEFSTVMHMMTSVGYGERVLGRISLKNNEENVVGCISDIKTIIKEFDINEIVFCQGDLSFKNILEQINYINTHSISFRFHANKSNSIVGSDSKSTTGETLAYDTNFKLGTPYYNRMKRMVDVWVSSLVFISFFVQIFLVKNPMNIFKNALLVLIGKRTWVGFSFYQTKLPPVAVGIINPQGFIIGKPYPVVNNVLKKTDYIYAKEYDWVNDLKIIFEHYKNLGG
jgi:GT2 family glycosyltransferase